MSESILRLRDVKTRTGLSRSSIYMAIKNDPTFPRPVSLGKRAMGFVASEVEAWIQNRIAKSRAA